MLKECDIHEITIAQGRVLFPLWQKNTLSFQELKQKTLLSKATLSYMLDQLEAGGHVERIRSENDKRTILVKLTKKEKDLMDKFIEVSNLMNSKFYKGFSEKEIDKFENFLKRLLQNLTNYNK
ncbi:MAG: MarR family winged helix-turn-helix transcriptional regulator [Candidatus Thorarchaeota archaeon]